MIIESKAVKDFFEHLLKNYDSERYFIQELDNELEFNQVPQEVKRTYNLYKQKLTYNNFDSIKVYKIFVDIIVFFAVYVIKNENNSYLEVYGQFGEQMASIRYDGKMIYWDNQEGIHADLN
ncbi:MAG: hypothetical protein SWZ49_18035 [Cyanobacteriota bacterium]|nr:hypothetical protein [Cyanobacteriota bacterium]